MTINTFNCSICGDKFKPSKSVLEMWDNGEIPAPDLCFDCLELEAWQTQYAETYPEFSDVDCGL